MTVSGGRGHTYNRLTLSRGDDPVMGGPSSHHWTTTGAKPRFPGRENFRLQTARWLLPGSSCPVGFTPAGPHDHLSQFLQGNILLWRMGCFSGDSNTFRTGSATPFRFLPLRRVESEFQAVATRGQQRPSHGDPMRGQQSGLGEPPENTRGRTSEHTHQGRESSRSERRGDGLIHISETLKNFNK